MMIVAFGATSHMPAKRFGSAGLDGRHHLELAEADMPGIGLPPRRAMGPRLSAPVAFAQDGELHLGFAR